jgi:hypothetical protein
VPERLARAAIRKSAAAPLTASGARLTVSTPFSQISSPAVALRTSLSNIGVKRYAFFMCRNIRPLFNFEPPATDDEVFAAALQYVRKVSNQRKPSGRNLITFDQAVQEIAAVTRRLVDSLETTSHPKNRDEEAAKAKAKSAIRFGRA